MAKDPAFLFYYQDFMFGTRRLSREQRGLYIELMCEQADSKSGSIPTSVMKAIWVECSFDVVPVMDKFEEDEDGFFNGSLREHLDKRRKYVKSRSNNRKKGSSDATHIYLIKDEDTGLIKIGNSVDPKRRLIELNNQFSKEFKLIGFTGKVEQSNESDLHKAFSENREHGEWFSVEETKIINHMKNHMSLELSNHMSSHMENVNEIENENVIKKEKIKEENIKCFDTLFRYWEENKNGKKYKNNTSRSRMLNKLKELTRNDLSFARKAILHCIDSGYQGFCNGDDLYYKEKTEFQKVNQYRKDPIVLGASVPNAEESKKYLDGLGKGIGDC